MKNKLSKLSRLLVFICGLALIAVLFTSIWKIYLDAPQYPEGLIIRIAANGLKGDDVEKINGLNHYIGMKELHTEDFVEFVYLPYLLILFAVLCFIVFIVNRKIYLNILFVLFLSFGVLAMYDFWHWEYNYGHNLDPHAAIIIPGMAYQPPLIGAKQLLNFVAFSIPDVGGWLFIGIGLTLLFCVIIEFKKAKQKLA